MAKRENTTDVTGGLSVENSVIDGLDFGASRERANGSGKNTTQKNSLAAGYKDRRNAEKRQVKLNLLLKPSIAKMLDESVEKCEIKSKNDLINWLLERYYFPEEQGKGF